MAPRLQLEKAAWRWVETVKPEDIGREHVELSYRVNVPACRRGTCRYVVDPGTRIPPTPHHSLLWWNTNVQYLLKKRACRFLVEQFIMSYFCDKLHTFSMYAF